VAVAERLSEPVGASDSGVDRNGEFFQGVFAAQFGIRHEQFQSGEARPRRARTLQHAELVLQRGASTSICMNARERSESRKVRTSETRMDVIARSVSRSHNNINTTASTVFSVGTSVTLPAQGELTMKKSRGGRMTAAKARAAKRKGGKGPVSKRKAGRKIMKT